MTVFKRNPTQKHPKVCALYCAKFEKNRATFLTNDSYTNYIKNRNRTNKKLQREMFFASFQSNRRQYQIPKKSIEGNSFIKVLIKSVLYK